MTAPAALRVLFSESQLRKRVAELAREIAGTRERPDLTMPILVGGFVFAADLLRALDGHGLSLPVEFLRLRNYGQRRAEAGDVRVLIGPDDNLRARHVLLIDGVLDHGHTLATARSLVRTAGVRAVSTAVVIDKRRQDALLTADFAAFINVSDFVVGYGMDDAGRLRSLPYVAAAHRPVPAT